MNVDLWLLPMLGGGCLGLVFFIGLWWTVSCGLHSPHPEVWFLASVVLRMGLTILGLIWLAQGRWERLVACLVGFLIVRGIVLSEMARRGGHQGSQREGGLTCD